MTNDEKVLKAIELFDNLSEEIMYGFNMKCELTAMQIDDPEMFEMIQDFINRCKSERA